MNEDCILVVDDDEKITRILKLQLSHNGYETLIASSGLEALSVFEENARIDLVLLDIMLPQMDGLSLCRRFRELNPKVRIVLVSARDKSRDVIEGLDSGADDYVKKPFVFDELLARIRANLRKSRMAETGGKLLTYKTLKIDAGTFEVWRGDRKLDLSTTEYDLLYYLTLNNNLVQSREHIIDQVWGDEYYGGLNIVDVYIKFLRDKVDKDEEEKLIQTVRGRGYVLR